MFAKQIINLLQLNKMKSTWKHVSIASFKFQIYAFDIDTRLREPNKATNRWLKLILAWESDTFVLQFNRQLTRLQFCHKELEYNISRYPKL